MYSNIARHAALRYMKITEEISATPSSKDDGKNPSTTLPRGQRSTLNSRVEAENKKIQAEAELSVSLTTNHETCFAQLNINPGYHYHHHYM